MTISDQLFNSDDMFVLGNTAAAAIVKGIHDPTLGILEFLSMERPQNAGSYLLYALILQSRGHIREAINYLEQSNAFEAEVNRDEALALHLVLLQADGQTDRVLDLGYAYIGEDIVTSESAHHTIRTVIRQTESILERRMPQTRFGGFYK